MNVREWIEERAVDVMLRAYPADFRTHYAREMRQLVRDRQRVGRETGARFWIEMLCDAVRSAPALHLEALRIIERPNHHYEREGTMRTMSILAVLAGVFQIANAMNEAWAGRSNAGGGSTLVGVALGVVAAILLVAAGVALLRRGWSAAAWARIAAVACVALVALTRVIQPWMSGLGLLIGIGVPVALLLFLFAAQRSGPSAPMAT